MKFRTLALLAVLAFIVVFVGSTTVKETAAQTQGTQNLLVNPGFEDGNHHQDQIAEIVVPDGWKLHWLDKVTFPGAWDNLPALRPESTVWNSLGGIPEGEEILWRDGIYNLKVFKAWAPMYAALSQDVSGLEVGRRYRLVAPVYPDLILEYKNGKVPPDRPDAGQVRLGASPVGAAWRDEGAIAYSGWWTGATVSPFYQTYVTFVYDFTATQENMTVWIEFRSTYPYSNNGFFLDTIGLYTLDEVDPSVSNPSPSGGGAAVPAGPTSTPMPTPTPRADGAVVHIVQSGDTLWTIAIRYAETMGLAPEAALPAIMELNNNPAFITAGQELMIVPPGQVAPTAEPAPAEEETAAETAVEEPTPEPTAVPVEEPTAAATTSSICVAAFNDADGNGQRDVAEGLLADAAISLFRGGANVSTYVTDGINEPYCFQNLEDDTYQVQIFPPADYVMTTTGNWAVAVSNGMSIAVEFGTKFDANAGSVAVADAGVAETAVPTTAPAPAETSSGSSNIGLIVLGAAVVLILLAGVGVFLLRQS
ncbi:MAG: LysM peptidoglycan-binding domain-containing protein [Ardenticatenaceae bacterium]|nr:LysM peptidoglycan-binding domain-containing protein [Ardenticatenaceae bacterium]MCB9443722.1 LysM peptidoglycan-binding domain-containing protein [Ardenticatenaceae bacterium]